MPLPPAVQQQHCVPHVLMPGEGETTTPPTTTLRHSRHTTCLAHHSVESPPPCRAPFCLPCAPRLHCAPPPPRTACLPPPRAPPATYTAHLCYRYRCYYTTAALPALLPPHLRCTHYTHTHCSFGYRLLLLQHVRAATYAVAGAPAYTARTITLRFSACLYAPRLTRARCNMPDHAPPHPPALPHLRYLPYPATLHSLAHPFTHAHPHTTTHLLLPHSSATHAFPCPRHHTHTHVGLPGRPAGGECRLRTPIPCVPVNLLPLTPQWLACTLTAPVGRYRRVPVLRTLPGGVAAVPAATRPPAVL